MRRLIYGFGVSLAVTAPACRATLGYLPPVTCLPSAGPGPGAQVQVKWLKGDDRLEPRVPDRAPLDSQ